SQLRTRCLAELASALMNKYRSTHEWVTLDEAVSAFEAALSSSPLSKPDWEGEILSNYVSALLERYVRDGSVEDLERANEVAITSSHSSKPGTAEFAARLVNIAAVLTYRYRRSGLLSDLDAAVEAMEGALETDLPPEIEAPARTNLGNVLRERYAVSGNAED